MARPDTVYSLFGLKSPQEVAQEQFEQSFSYTPGPSGYQRAGAGLGTALGMLARSIAGPTEEMQQAEALEEIARDYQPGNLQNMATTFTRLREAGAPAETLQQLSSDITARSTEVNELAQERRARNAGLEFLRRENSELADLAEAGAIDMSDAITSIRDAKKPVKVGDVLVNPANIDPETNQAAIVFDARTRQPNTTYTILTAEEKKSLGLPPGVQYQRGPDGKLTKIAGAGVPGVGSIPPGYQLSVTTGANPGETTMKMVPIPGSPAAQKQEDQLKAAQNKRRNTGKKVNAAFATIDEARALVNDPEAWVTGAAGRAVDVSGQLSGGILSAGTPRLALRETLGTLRANIGFDRLQAMRDESPTGGALGQVAIQELNDLQRTIAALNPDLDKETLLSNIDRVEQQYSDTAEALANAYTDQQLTAAGIPELIPFRTGEVNPETGEFEIFPAAEEDFDVTSLPADIQEVWEFMTEEERALWME